MKIKAENLQVGMKVVVRNFGEKKVYPLTKVQLFPKLANTYGAAFVAVGTEEWDRGVPGLGANFDLDEEIEVEECISTVGEKSPMEQQ